MTAPPTADGSTAGAAGPRVLIVDDQALVRSGFRMILDAAGIEVVGEAVDGETAVRLAGNLGPDVVLMDIRMPGLDGLRATEQILARGGDCRVIMLTTFDVDRYVFQALRIGASGFLLKDVTPEFLVAAIRAVHTGDALLSPSVTRRLVERFVDEVAAEPVTTGERSAQPVALPELTAREREVLALLGRGLSNAELAERLFLSPATIKTHVARIFSKLGLRDRAQAVVVAYEHRLVRPGDEEGEALPDTPAPPRPSSIT